MRVICHTWGCAVSVRMNECAARFCPVCGNPNITIVADQNSSFYGKDNVKSAEKELDESEQAAETESNREEDPT